MAENLWKIPNVSSVRTPLAIMKEQAEYLGASTSNILLGEVGATSVSNDRLLIEFRIVAPYLNRYTYSLLTYIHPIYAMYPGQLVSNIHDQAYMIENEDQLIKYLSAIFTSSESVRLLEGLLAQAHSA